MTPMTEKTHFEHLIDTLPSLTRAPGAHPWDAPKLLRWLCGGALSHGEALAARFVLGVWNVHADWPEEARSLALPYPDAAKRFDVLEAVSVWDEPHLHALRSWLRDPQFP